MRFLLLFITGVATAATDFGVGILNQVPVTPSTVQENTLTLAGISSFTVTANAVVLPHFGYPYTFTYTSKPIGQINTITVDYCKYDGTTGSVTFNISSGGAATVRSGGSSFPRRR